MVNGGTTWSHAFIDASQLGSANDDICTKLNDALQQLALAAPPPPIPPPLYNDEGVIDARGVTNLNCAGNPWMGFAYGANRPPYSTILLPAGTILISTPWTLAARTRLIGQGSCFGSDCSSPSLTTIKANGNFSNAALLQMGGQYPGQHYVCPASECPPGTITAYNCNGVVIEHLMLDGNNTASGIENDYSQELSSVNDVAMVNIATGGTGLKLTQHDHSGNSPGHDADNSGPYSNLYISGSGTCVSINNTHGTRGIHGLSCVSTGTGSAQMAAVFLDGYNNTLEDVSIYSNGGPGFTNGVLIGSAGPAANGNLVLNITGDTKVTNLIHISGNGSPTDLTLMGVSTPVNQTAIYDELQTPHLALAGPYVGMYLIGDAVEGGYSRFTTSAVLPTWLVGTTTQSGPCPVPGDLYSNTGSGGTLWGCPASGGWTSIVP